MLQFYVPEVESVEQVCERWEVISKFKNRVAQVIIIAWLMLIRTQTHVIPTARFIA